MKALLSSLILISATPAFAALPQHMVADSRSPLSAIAVCDSANRMWEKEILRVRNDVIATLGAYPDKAAIFVTRIYGLESIADLPLLLESAELPHLADRLRITFRQLNVYRDARCRDF